MKKYQIDQDKRYSFLTNNLNLNLPGIEIAPLFRPTVRKDEANVFYVDVCTADESRRKHEHYEHEPIVEIDVIWSPGTSLKDCVPPSSIFHWAIASHVLEHVPDPLGWLNQVLEVLPTGGTIALALPRKEYCFDKFRNDTTTAEMIEAWIHRYQVPSSRQVYDFISNSVSNGYLRDGFENLDDFNDCEKSYSFAEAFSYVKRIFHNREYLDVHCNVFNPSTIIQIFDDLTALGILNVRSWLTLSGDYEEFFVCVQKMGEPSEVIDAEQRLSEDYSNQTVKYSKKRIFLIKDFFTKKLRLLKSK